MKSPTIDNFYYSIQKETKLIEAYSEVYGLEKIIKMTRCKPYSILFGKKPRKVILYEKWIDEYNCSLSLNKKKIVISTNEIHNGHICNTDIYNSLDIFKVSKISKLCFLFFNDNEKIYIISFLGLDGYLRSYFYEDDKWINMSSLHLGLHNLQFIVHNTELMYHRPAPIDKNWNAPCEQGEAWLTYLPASGDFRRELENKCANMSFAFLKNT